MKNSLIILLFFFVVTGYAQNYELGKVTKSELEQKVHPSDTSAVAAFLFKKAKTLYKYNEDKGFTLITEYSIKLKIYKKEGLKWANFEIPYYVGYENLDDEVISISKAFTYNLEEGKIVKEKVAGDGKFKEKINDLWETKLVTFPNVKVGSVIELKYELRSQNLSELPTFQYQYNIPVDYAQFWTEVPEFYIYKAIKTGYIDVHMNDVLEDFSQGYETKYGNTNYLNYRQIKTIYEAMDVPALIEEEYVSNIDDYYSKIENELQTIRYPEQAPKQIATTWEDVAKSIYAEKEFGAELDKNNYFLNDLKRILKDIDSKEERAKAIFEFVKDKMNWNGKYGYYTKKGVETAYAEGSGNVAEINLILTSMLRMGGLEANPVLMSTRDNGVALFPNRSKFNYVIASIVIEGKQILLDATSKFATLKCLPTRDLNSKGRLINKDGSSLEIDLMPNFNSGDTVNSILNIDDKGVVSGKIREQYSDYYALKFRDNFGGMAKESYLEKLEKKYPGLEVIDYELTNDNLVYEPVIETYSFKNNSVTEIIGDKMFFSPMLYLAETQNPFKQEDRQYPVDFAFPSKKKHAINITIPDGYKVESLPKPSNISTEGKDVSFSFSISNTEKQISVVVNLDINNSIVPASHYASLKEIYKLLIEKENEKIVLKKI